MATSTQETQELVSPDSEELLVAPDSKELVAPELLASYSSSSDEAAAVAKGKSTGKPAMEFTPESELNVLELDDAPESEELLVSCRRPRRRRCWTPCRGALSYVLAAILFMNTVSHGIVRTRCGKRGRFSHYLFEPVHK